MPTKDKHILRYPPMEAQIRWLKIDKLIRRNPIASLLSAAALLFMALNAPSIGSAWGANNQQRSAIGTANQALQSLQINEQHRAELAAIADSRYDRGCEMVFSAANPATFTAINPGEPVLDGSGANTYLPAGAIVCDAYGNTAALIDEDTTGLAVAREFASTQDKDRVQQAMQRTSATEPQN